MKDLPVSSLISIVFGILIILAPHILAYLIGIYLILTGVMAINRTK